MAQPKQNQNGSNKGGKGGKAGAPGQANRNNRQGNRPQGNGQKPLDPKVAALSAVVTARQSRMVAAVFRLSTNTDLRPTLEDFKNGAAIQPAPPAKASGDDLTMSIGSPSNVGCKAPGCRFYVVKVSATSVLDKPANIVSMVTDYEKAKTQPVTVCGANRKLVFAEDADKVLYTGHMVCGWRIIGQDLEVLLADDPRSTDTKSGVPKPIVPEGASDMTHFDLIDMHTFTNTDLMLNRADMLLTIDGTATMFTTTPVAAPRRMIKDWNPVEIAKEASRGSPPALAVAAAYMKTFHELYGTSSIPSLSTAGVRTEKEGQLSLATYQYFAQWAAFAMVRGVKPQRVSAAGTIHRDTAEALDW